MAKLRADLSVVGIYPGSPVGGRGTGRPSFFLENMAKLRADFSVVGIYPGSPVGGGAPAAPRSFQKDGKITR
ncbi:hypothetical protein [Chitinophaga jiangningensis]|uniref:hypothetical protein n=1 Tax=Chitinophaga jiangningensis TaxID=1419482 RepID=UPI001160A01D|nr:hypothetical protein [Chitinophaga jiangningensis]